MKMEWPQITWIVLALVGWAYSAAYHGKPYQHPISWHMKTVAIVLNVWLLWCGGFFAP